METRKSQYNKKGMYSGYKKNNKEREALDYYSTPTEEVTHILNILNFHLKDKRLSLKAKGLLSVMLSLPKNWDYSIAGLVAISKESESCIKAILDEIERT